nr:hypothetical protein CFP56_11431 [Quercus suber]
MGETAAPQRVIWRISGQAETSHSKNRRGDGAKRQEAEVSSGYASNATQFDLTLRRPRRFGSCPCGLLDCTTVSDARRDGAQLHVGRRNKVAKAKVSSNTTHKKRTKRIRARLPSYSSAKGSRKARKARKANKPSPRELGGYCSRLGSSGPTSSAERARCEAPKRRMFCKTDDDLTRMGMETTFMKQEFDQSASRPRRLPVLSRDMTAVTSIHDRQGSTVLCTSVSSEPAWAGLPFGAVLRSTTIPEGQGYARRGQVQHCAVVAEGPTEATVASYTELSQLPFSTGEREGGVTGVYSM